MKKKASERIGNIVMNLILLFYSVICIYPFVLTFFVSFTSERSLMKNGYQLIPEEFSTAAYQTIFKDSSILQAYGITFSITLIGTTLSLLICSLAGYAMSLQRVKYRNVLAMYFYIPTVFSAGLLPWYLVCTEYLHLKDSYWALILPMLVSTFNIFLLRNGFKSVPTAVLESAEMDGCGPYRTFFQLVIPLSKPVIATVALFIGLAYWNDWSNALWFINKQELYPLQYMLYRIKSRLETALQTGQFTGDVPTQTYQIATLFVTIGPIVLLYPFIQRYFVKGIMIGAVKG